MRLPLFPEMVDLVVATEQLGEILTSFVIGLGRPERQLIGSDRIILTFLRFVNASEFVTYFSLRAQEPGTWETAIR